MSLLCKSMLLDEFVVQIHEAFEVAHGLHFQLERGVLVDDEDRLGMLLEGGDCPHVIDTFLDRLVQGVWLVSTSDQYHHLKLVGKFYCITRTDIYQKRTSFASMTVCTPTVSACVGTWLTSPPKKRAFASIVSTASVLILVRDARLDPGSLNAMWPSAPIPASEPLFHTKVGQIRSRTDSPPMKSSTPPAAFIFASNSSHSFCRFSAFPSRMWTHSGLMSMCLKKLLNINEW